METTFIHFRANIINNLDKSFSSGETGLYHSCFSENFVRVLSGKNEVDDEDDFAEFSKMEDELKCAHWQTTKVFINATRGKSILALTGTFLFSVQPSSGISPCVRTD